MSTKNNHKLIANNSKTLQINLDRIKKKRWDKKTCKINKKAK